MTPWYKLLTSLTQKLKTQGITVEEFRLLSAFYEHGRALTKDEVLNEYLNGEIIISDDSHQKEGFLSTITKLVDTSVLEWEGDNLTLSISGEFLVVEIYQIAQARLTNHLFSPERYN
ncbi:hypothetical protein [Photobacterium damselae]|uniref:Uncharacterized protein n=1 Tax=Photobacterium damselae subsp. damselae TaxID=85581 RepID=A0A7Y7UDI4_PHODD|nr:hypothetical protein [Photobacterium damselae]AWK84669.1 hypothetical protein BST98_21825 [Photobacterium damselae]MCG3826461.1 hypothetical protein [Photobacterium damselae]NVO59014.1 hypothetical protein [Photobacterium damselae subsp. damselae]NVP00389.1 hypothetical protein [Photobacterium damselae subsp. damselae]PSB81642.1 hypothetical protein C5F64_17310 [Photobacterium damselae subsp. damselae]